MFLIFLNLENIVLSKFKDAKKFKIYEMRVRPLNGSKENKFANFNLFLHLRC